MNKLSIEKIMNTLTFLYIEDDPLYIDNVSKALEVKCRKVFKASNIKDASLAYSNNKIDLIITEFMLEDNLMLEFIKNIRKNDLNIPIIVISKQKDTEYLLEAIKLNLTEYIVKPINLRLLRDSLLLSVSKILSNGNYEVLFENNIKYNVKKKLLTKDDEEINITSSETFLLEVLIANQHYALSKDEIIYNVWKDEYNVSDGAFKTLLNRLRNKIGKKSIKRVSGSRYILETNF